jgi:hypothetical protein
MRPTPIRVGDVVAVDRLGQRFHARVAGNASGAYRSSRLTGASSYGVVEPVM